MSTGDEYNDDFDSFDKEPGGERYEEPWESAEQPGPKKKPGMSSGVKVLIILLCVFGGFAVICCGVGIYFFNEAMQGMVETPADVNALTQEIVDIEIPAEQFQPQTGMRLSIFFGMKLVEYNSTTGNGKLILMEMNIPGGDAEEQERQMREAMQEQGFGDEPLVDKNSETRTFNIKGKQVDFQFAEAENSAGAAYRKVSGVFPGKSGTAFLQIQIEEEAYDEEAVVEMIKSIK